MSMENIFIIPTTVPKQNTITATSITVVYASTTGPVREADTVDAATTTCFYFQDALRYGMGYHTDISLRGYNCPWSTVPGTPLKIEFKVTASFSKWDGFNPYTNRLLPDQKEVDEQLLLMLQHGNTAGPWMPSLHKYLKDTLSEGNPYRNLTGLAPA